MTVDSKAVEEFLNSNFFVERVENIAQKSVKSFLLSPLHILFLTCIITLSGYILHTNIQTLNKLSESMNGVKNSLTLLNSSLAVIDERTRRNEESVIELEKLTYRIAR